MEERIKNKVSNSEKEMNENEDEVEDDDREEGEAEGEGEDEGDDESNKPSEKKEKESQKEREKDKERQKQTEKSKTTEAKPNEEEVPAFSLEGKKKKKKKPKVEDESVAGADGTLPWDGSDRDYNYTELLERITTLLREKNPTLAGGRKRHIMPPPQLIRVGTRKTMWANFSPICELMHRQPEHVMSFLLSELGTEGSIDASQRCVMKGRYIPKQIESILKKYISEYVTCHMCRNPETSLTRDSVTRLYFIQCESCGSRRSVAPIKTGFHATNRSDRRKVKDAQ